MNTLPCPFCGELPITEKSYRETGGDCYSYVFTVKCINTKCTAQPASCRFGPSEHTRHDAEYGRMATNKEAELKVIEDWNTRITANAP